MYATVNGEKGLLDINPQHDAALRSARLMEGGSALGIKARAVLADLDDATVALSNACARIFQLDFLPDFIDPLGGVDNRGICMGIVERLATFSVQQAPAMIRAIDAGDEDAMHDFIVAVTNLHAVARSEAQRVGATLTFGAQLSAFTDEVILKTGRDVTKAAKGTFPFLVVIGVAALFIFAWSKGRS